MRHPIMRWHRSHGQGILGIVKSGRLEVCSDCGTPKGHAAMEQPCKPRTREGEE